MGYLSCKTESSIATADSHAPTPSTPSSNKFRHRSSDNKGKPFKIQEFNYKDLELATNNFSNEKLLGRGSHGLVYKGVFRGGRLVAIKNPCLMVETVGRPVQPRDPQADRNLDDEDGKSRMLLRNTRVYSDLGFRSNLMELMAGADGRDKFLGGGDELEPKVDSGKRISSFRLESGGLADRANIRAMILGNGRSRMSNLSRNKSVGESSHAFSGRVDKISG